MTLPPNWETLTAEQRAKWLRDRCLVYYGGHLVTAEMWANNSAGIREAIDARNVKRLERALAAQAQE